MRNFKLLFFSVAVAAASIFIYSCAKEKDMSESTGKSTVSSTSNRSNAVNYPAQDYKIWQIGNSEYTIVYPISNLSNTDFWIVQKPALSTSEAISVVSNVNLSFNKYYMQISNSTTDLVYLLLGNTYQNYPPNASGLIKLKDDSLLAALRSMNNTTKGGVIDDVNEKAVCNKNGTSDSGCKCAGGANSTSCECGGSVASVSWHEQVSCGEGHYACCSGL